MELSQKDNNKESLRFFKTREEKFQKFFYLIQNAEKDKGLNSYNLTPFAS